MQKNNSQNAILILKKLKKALKISTDIQLSEFLNIKPNTISSWKKRDTLDYNSVISICELYEIDLNEIFLDQDRQTSYSNYSSETPLICREVQFQYCLGNESLLESLPKFHFPFIQGLSTRAFQILSSNMAPIIEENSYAVCESCDINSVADSSLVVIISRSKGFFINRIAKNHELHNTYILSSENAQFNPIMINASEINEIWMVKGVMSYPIQHNQQLKVAEVQKKK